MYIIWYLHGNNCDEYVYNLGIIYCFLIDRKQSYNYLMEVPLASRASQFRCEVALTPHCPKGCSVTTDSLTRTHSCCACACRTAARLHPGCGQLIVCPALLLHVSLLMTVAITGAGPRPWLSALPPHSIYKLRVIQVSVSSIQCVHSATQCRRVPSRGCEISYQMERLMQYILSINIPHRRVMI